MSTMLSGACWYMNSFTASRVKTSSVSSSIRLFIRLNPTYLDHCAMVSPSSGMVKRWFRSRGSPATLASRMDVSCTSFMVSNSFTHARRYLALGGMSVYRLPMTAASMVPLPAG